MTIFARISAILCNGVQVGNNWFYLSGSLVMEHPGEASTPFQGCVLFGTVNGTIGEKWSYPSFSFCAIRDAKTIVFIFINFIKYVFVKYCKG